MNKKGIIIGLIVIVLLIIAGIAGYVIYTGNEKDDKKKSDDSLYASFIKDLIKDKDLGLECRFVDLDEDGNVELIVSDSYYSSSYSPELTIYAITDGKVKEITKTGKEKTLCLLYDIEGDKYLYGYADIQTNEEDYYAEPNITQVYPITKITGNPKGYDVNSKEYKEKYITIPYSYTLVSYISSDIFYSSSEDIKSTVKESIKDVQSVDVIKNSFYFDIESLKQENEQSVNAPSNEDAEKLGKELFDYITNITQHIKLNEEQIEIAQNIYGQEILNYEEAFENKFTTNFINSYWYREGSHYYIKDNDGKKYLVTPGYGGNLSYLGQEMNLKEANDSKITFTLTGYFIENMDEIEKTSNIQENYKENLEKANIKYTTQTEEFIIVKDGDTWKIDEFVDLRV